MVTARLADLLRDGVRLDYSDPDKPEFRVLPQHRPQVAALLAPAVRPETQRTLRAVADYRRTLLRLFTLTTQGPDADPDEAREAVQTEMRLHDDLGVRLAGLIRAAAVTDYSARTARCAYCGGVEHSPEGDR